jgi:rod shape-determining protein MreC
MRQIAFFIEKYKYFLLFLVLEIFAFLLTVQSHSFHKSQFINSANSITGGFFNTSSSFFEYTSLKSENQKLAEENTTLRNALDLKINETFTFKIDSSLQKNIYITAKVTKNSYNKRNNVLTINKGTKHGLSQDMGVINSQGIVGVINNLTTNYATVLSILNSHSKINARLKNSNYIGTLSWNGNTYKTAQLDDIQRQAAIKIGDTIVTGGKSTLFPEGILIGTIKSFEFNSKKYENIQILLANDMSNLGYVHIIKNVDKDELELLESYND